MGKYALLVTLAVILGVTYISQQSQRTSETTNKEIGERQGIVISRQIARSAFNDGVSVVKRGLKKDSLSDGDTRQEEGAYEQGTYVWNYDVMESGGNTEVDIMAQGTYRDTTYEITGRVVRDTSVSSLYNGITANIPITFNVAGGGCSGGPCVSGIDAAGAGDRHGISLPPGTDTDQVCNEFDGDVEGREDGCDVTARTEEHDTWVNQQMDQLDSEIQEADEQGNVTTCDGCKISNLADTSGILYVTGKLTFDGEEQWDGLVYVADGGSVRINGGGDIENINGGLVMGDSTEYDYDEFEMNGGNSVKYNSEMLMKYMNTIPSIGASTITVTDRTGRVVRP